MVRCFDHTSSTHTYIPTGADQRETTHVENRHKQGKTRRPHELTVPTRRHRKRRELQNHEKRQAHNQTFLFRLEDPKSQLQSQEAQAAVKEVGRGPRIPCQRPSGRCGWRNRGRGRVGQRQDTASEFEVEARGDEAEGEAGDDGEMAVWKEHGSDGYRDGYGCYKEC